MPNSLITQSSSPDTSIPTPETVTSPPTAVDTRSWARKLWQRLAHDPADEILTPEMESEIKQKMDALLEGRSAHGMLDEISALGYVMDSYDVLCVDGAASRAARTRLVKQYGGIPGFH